MVRRVAVSLVLLAACVGDDPASPTSSSGGPDSGAPTVDAGGEGGSDTGTPSSDAGTDASACIPIAPNVISWWTGDDTLMDRSNANNMAPSNDAGTVGYVAGKVGNAFSFAGTTWLERPLPMGLSSLGGFTVEAWVRQTAQANQRIFDRSTAGANDGWWFDIWLTHLRFAIGTASAESSIVLAPGTTYHVAGTFDGSSIRVFVDGIEVGQAGTGGVTTVLEPQHALRIGGANDGSATWNGFIDEPAMYSRALTPAEIKAIYDAGSNGRCKQ